MAIPVLRAGTSLKIWFLARKLIEVAIDLFANHRTSFLIHLFSCYPSISSFFDRFIVFPNSRQFLVATVSRCRSRFRNGFVYISRNRFAVASEYFSLISEHFVAHLFSVYFAPLDSFSRPTGKIQNIQTIEDGKMNGIL